jgi:diaminopimelate epimerase
MTDPAGLELNIPVEIKGEKYSGGFVNTGVPHFVIEVKKLLNMNIVDPGRQIRYHARFSPKGTNVMFVEKAGPDKYMIRSYERGVEDETLACGTGATAAAVILHASGKTKSPVTMLPPGGKLKISFEYRDGKYTDVFLEGPAAVIAEGVLLEDAFK